MKKIIPLVITGCILMGCSVNSSQSSNSGIIVETLPSAMPPNINTDNKIPESTPIKTIENTEPDYQKYVKFLNINAGVSKYIKEDIDLDGKQEVVIAFGKDSDLKVYVLREEGDTLQNLGQLKNTYITNDFELIRLQGNNQKYIEVFLANGVGLYGFATYEIK